MLISDSSRGPIKLPPSRGIATVLLRDIPHACNPMQVTSAFKYIESASRSYLSMGT